MEHDEADGDNIEVGTYTADMLLQPGVDDSTTDVELRPNLQPTPTPILGHPSDRRKNALTVQRLASPILHEDLDKWSLREIYTFCDMYNAELALCIRLRFSPARSTSFCTSLLE